MKSKYKILLEECIENNINRIKTEIEKSKSIYKTNLHLKLNTDNINWLDENNSNQRFLIKDNAELSSDIRSKFETDLKFNVKTTLEKYGDISFPEDWDNSRPGYYGISIHIHYPDLE